MWKRLPRKFGLVAIGVLLILWGTISAFSNYSRSVAAVDPLDNPDIPDAQVVNPTFPADTIPSKTPFQPAQPTDSGEGDAFSVPLAGSTLSSTADSMSLAPTGTPAPTGLAPDRIVIPAIHLDAPISPVTFRVVKSGKQTVQQWLVPDAFKAGWLAGSALLGVPGNTVLDGHHNVWGEVFGHLIDLKPGDSIYVYSGDTRFHYILTNKMILPERDQPLDVRISNAQWLLPSSDERLTLVTCWPHTSNTHRLILVATPAGRADVSGGPDNSLTP